MRDDLDVNDDARVRTSDVVRDIELVLLRLGRAVDGGCDAGAGASGAVRGRVRHRLLLDVVERVEVADRELVGERGDGAPPGAALQEARNRDAKLGGTLRRAEAHGGVVEGACGRIAELLRDGGKGETVVRACLLREAEEHEEDDTTHDRQPRLQSQRPDLMGGRPLDRGELFNAREAPVQVCQASPFVDGAARAEDDEVGSEGDGAEQLHGSESHETEVAVERQVAVRREQIAKLSSPPRENYEGCH